MLPVIVTFLAATALLIFYAAAEQRAHDWRRCLSCPRWFDRRGTTTNKLPWIARFAIHGDGTCPTCSQERKQDAASVEEQSFQE